MTEREKYIEEVGLHYEKYGLTRMSGRILGCLISSKTDNNSFGDLQETLKASKGSISGNLNILSGQEMIDKHMIPGDRKTYYRISLKSLKDYTESRYKSIIEFKELLNAGLVFNDNSESDNHRNVEIISKYFEFLEKELPLLAIKWEKEKEKIQSKK